MIIKKNYVIIEFKVIYSIKIQAIMCAKKIGNGKNQSAT